MNANGKYTQYITQKDKGSMSPFEQKVEDFLEFLCDVGIVANKNDAFIIRRRYKLIAKEVKGNYRTIPKPLLSRRDLAIQIHQS